MGGGGKNEIKETEAEKAAAEVAMKQWELYQSDLKGFETGFIKRVDNINSAANMADVKESVDLGYSKSYSDARDKTADTMTASGIDPSSSKFKGAMNKLTTEQAVKQGDTVNRAQVGEQDKHVAGLQDVVAIGMGQKAESLAGMGDSASLSLRKATTDAYNDFNQSAAMAQTVGATAGAAASYSLRNAQTPSLNKASVDGRSTVKPVNTYNHMTNPDGTMMA
ncbi:hypothetical protein [Photobacterium sp. OFAV2-7]|uniref:hypothetical protein n=1 Tax=Photobacterium sp. OFAV2-7 TaxID=2917748 RepID=UPI001EF42E81|nr:hypothetical protein [Photobacterium sp. OFAV2-7]MCG7587079.1 hypothetical protein [Photobacterium sp. OFAV2-7]